MNLECDGFARVVAQRLLRCDSGRSKPVVYLGTVSDGENSISPHYWVEWEGYRIDYSTAKVYFPESNLSPIFRTLESVLSYEGSPVDWTENHILASGRLLEEIQGFSASFIL